MFLQQSEPAHGEEVLLFTYACLRGKQVAAPAIPTSFLRDKHTASPQCYPAVLLRTGSVRVWKKQKIKPRADRHSSLPDGVCALGRTRAQARKLVEIAARPLVPKQGEGLLGGRVYHHKLMVGFKAKSKAETSGDAGFEPAYMKLLGGELKERDERSEAPLRGMVAGPSVVGCA